MTGDQLYDRVKQILREQDTPHRCYYATKLMMMFHLMEKVERPVEWRWKKAS